MSENIAKPKDRSARLPWIAFGLSAAGYMGYIGSQIVAGVSMGLGYESHLHLHLLIRAIAGLCWFAGLTLAIAALFVFLRTKTDSMRLPLIVASIPTVILPLIGHFRRFLSP